MDRRLSDLADQLAAGHLARREFLRRAAVLTGGTAAGLHVLRRMASAQSGPKLRVWLFKSYVTAGNDILARHVETRSKRSVASCSPDTTPTSLPIARRRRWSGTSCGTCIATWPRRAGGSPISR
jgi:hypothetical protein